MLNCSNCSCVALRDKSAYWRNPLACYATNSADAATTPDFSVRTAPEARARGSTDLQSAWWYSDLLPVVSATTSDLGNSSMVVPVCPLTSHSTHDNVVTSLGTESTPNHVTNRLPVPGHASDAPLNYRQSAVVLPISTPNSSDASVPSVDVASEE